MLDKEDKLNTVIRTIQLINTSVHGYALSTNELSIIGIT